MKSVMIEDGKEATCIFLSIYLFIFNLNKLGALLEFEVIAMNFCWHGKGQT